MFDKILVANRGEIACRVIKTLKKMGIRSVAVYSEADTNSLHVNLADEAYYIGPSPATSSYLNVNNILEAIRATGAQAVHPGYGFLSENPLFAKALEEEGIAFIAPSQHAIHAMGDKIEAKKIAVEAGVSTVPGYLGVIRDASDATRIASEIGYPVMVKAAAGGGGKGMRIVHNEEEIKQAFSSATNEAKNSFSDGRIFIEKFIQNPRHIEIQLIADKYANYICLGERECSIQRHHQKVIEEAPSPFIDEATRQEMYRQTKSLASKVGYFSAGTVEYIMDENRKFYFLEMNTRLQVEHPVTELVTGYDIVELMIRVAAGEQLPFAQDDVRLNGWAIESRIYAEDPTRGFLPSSGRISEYREPQKSPNIRVDTGVYEGGEVSMFYDAMIAKLCSYGQDRMEAIEHMKSALSQYMIGGISHNISFLEAVMSNQRFREGRLSTNFIAEEYPGGFAGAELTSEISRIFLATAMFIFIQDAKRAAETTGRIPGRERQIGTRWVVSVDNDHYPVYARITREGFAITLEKDDKIITKSNWIIGSKLFKAVVDDKNVSVKIEHFAGGYLLTYAGRTVRAKVRSPRVAELEKFMPEKDSSQGQRELKAPISGLVVAIKVEKGEEVKPGQDLVIIEAMKMENTIKAISAAKVAEISIQKGDAVASGQLMIEFE